MRVVVLGARGFVGSAFVRLLNARGVDCVSVDRSGYAEAPRHGADVLINAAGNSAKYIADRDPVADFEQTVSLTLRAASDFRPGLYVLVSSVDVYPRLWHPEWTRESSVITPLEASVYGFHKRLAELSVQRHAGKWLIPRLAGMVGPGLRKNPVYDVLHGEPLRIHPDSQYQFMTTDDAAAAVWELIAANVDNEIYNVCGRGVMSPREIAELAGRPLHVHPEAARAEPRIVNVSIEKISAIRSMPSTRESVAAFVREREAAPQ
jgi:nucleoside-diphosphate-sugar epimerase